MNRSGATARWTVELKQDITQRWIIRQEWYTYTSRVHNAHIVPPFNLNTGNIPHLYIFDSR